MGGMIRKILIANRGEIAVRVIRTAKKLGIRTVAVYSRIDHDSLHVSQADDAYCIGEVELSETYLNIEKIIDVAKRAGCDAIHPGYGFLAENPKFVDACDAAGIIFIGPRSKVMNSMGNKIEARSFMQKIGIPITEGVTGDKATLMKAKDRIGLPVLLKAAAGGGGKGMRIVYDEKELEEAIESTSRQALAYFGDPTVYIEKYLEDPRHIEFQILGDNFGNVIHLFERECSIQRRYQKIIEESPSPTLTPEIRQKMGEAAVKIGKETGYNNAGTIEFLVDKGLNFYFLEMNTRIQVEHPVTEMVTGIDIVEEQIHIASGNRLRLRQEDMTQHGHAIECRIYAEDPENNFQPSPGIMTLYKEPEMNNIRIDKGIGSATEIKSSFDPMICKLVAWGRDRDEAGQIMTNALNEYIIHGIRTNIAFLTKLLQNPAFIENKISTAFCDRHTDEIAGFIKKDKGEIPFYLPVIGFLLSNLHKRYPEGSYTHGGANVWKEIGYWRNQMGMTVKFEQDHYPVNILHHSARLFEVEIGGERYVTEDFIFHRSKLEFSANGNPCTAYISEDKNNNAYVTVNGSTFSLRREDMLSETVSAAKTDSLGKDSDHVASPMPGKVIKINIKEGDEVKKGDLLLIVEAMKMENKLVSPRDAVISKVNVLLNERVEAITPLILLEKMNGEDLPVKK
jgi:3-methylcrotonyl-CoA carboxylase alpha subunit